MTMTSEVENGRRILRVQDVVVQRKVPFNEEGMSALRKIKTHLQTELSEIYGEDVSLPYPSIIHLVLLDYLNLRGIQDVQTTTPESGQ